MGAEVEALSVRESLEEEKRRVEMERESREGQREREREDSQVMFVEKEVDGERMMEINLDALEAADEDEDVDEEEEEEEAESPPRQSAPTEVETSPLTSVVRSVPMSEVVARGVGGDDVAASPLSSSTPRLSKSELSTDDELNSAVRAEPVTSSSTAVSASPSPQAEEAMVDLVDDDMDEETKLLVRAAQDRVSKRRLLTREDDRPLKHRRTESLPLSEDALIDSAQAASLPRAVQQPDFHSITSHVSLDSSMQPPAPRVAEVGKRRRGSSSRASPLVDAEAEDEDVVQGRRSTSPNESDDAEGADEYEEDGFLTKDTSDSNATTAQQVRSTHSELDAAKDAEAVEALHAKFVTRTGSTVSRPPIQRSMTVGLQRRGSQGSGPSASPVKAASPAPPAGVVRRNSSLPELDLLDDDRRLSDGEEEDEEADDNSSARQHKRALLQHRARMLKRLGAASPSPTSSPLKARTLSRFDLSDDTSLPPLPSPLHPPTRNATLKGALLPPPDFTSLHAQISRQSGVVRRGSFNSFLGESGGWKGGMGVGGASGRAGQGGESE